MRRQGGDRQNGPRDVHDSALHAGRNEGGCQSYSEFRPGIFGRRHYPWQHVSSDDAAGDRGDGAAWRPAQVHVLGQIDTYRQRRVPGLQPGQFARHKRGRRRLQEPHRRTEDVPRS